MSHGYEIVEELGKGTYGVVFLCRRSYRCCFARRKDTNQEIVQKEIKLAALNKNEISKLLEEVKVLERFRDFPHRNLVEAKGYLHANDSLCIYMEYCERGSLAADIDSQQKTKIFYDERTILDYTHQIASGLHHMHQHLVIHRDLKPANILITRDGVLKLADFGISALLGNKSSLRASVVGTPLNMAPEIINEEGYSFCCDIWAFGTILYELMTLKPAFYASNSGAVMMKIVNGNFPPLETSYAEPLKGLVTLMLVVDPSKRPDSRDIAALKFLSDRKIDSSSMSELDALPSKKAKEKERNDGGEKQQVEEIKGQEIKEEELRQRENEDAEQPRQLNVHARGVEVNKHGQEEERKRGEEVDRLRKEEQKLAPSAAEKGDSAKEIGDTPLAHDYKIKKRVLTEQEKNLINEWEGTKFEEWKKEGVGGSIWRKTSTILHHASMQGHVQLVTALLTRGDAIDATTVEGYTPLYVASVLGNTDQVISLLIQNGADVNHIDNFGRTPLHCSSQQGKAERAAVLIKAGADVNAKTGKDISITTTANHAQISTTIPVGSTPLHIACHLGKTDFVTLLIQNGADVNHKNNKGQTPLHCASEEGKADNVMLLIENGADVNHINSNGQTPLHCASVEGKTEAVRVLLRNKADKNIEDNDGNMPRNVICKSIFATFLTNKSQLHVIEQLLDE